MAKVSICIPAYNNEQSVRRLLESVEIQTFRDYEVIITDDSGDDRVAALAKDKEYVRFYKNEPRLGSTANWNEAVKKSTGEYIKIMHHDDWFTDENSLQAFVDMLDAHPEADFAFSGTRQVEADNVFDRYITDAAAELIKEDYRNLYLGNTIGAPSAVIVRRSTGADYDEKLKWLVDMEYYMHILKENGSFVYTKEPLVSIGIGDGQLTQVCRDDGEINAFEYGYIFEKYNLGQEEKYKEKLIKVFTDAGKEYEQIKHYGIDETLYKKEGSRKFLSKIKWKLTHAADRRLLACILTVLFVLSLIPVFMLSGVNQATGDDFGYGKLTHAAWLTTHSFTEVIKAACETVRNYYQGWQGTWLSVFLFTFQPEVFSPEAYVIVPYLMLFLWIGSTSVLLYYLLVKMAGWDKYSYLAVNILLLGAGIQFVPSTKSAIFWYNGTAHYIIPYTIALFGIYFFLRFMNAEGKKGAPAYIGMLICMFLLGGVNYQAALLAPIVIVLLLMAGRNKGKAAACLLPLLLEAAGLIISIKSPGNKSRGGEEFGFSIGQVVSTILECFVRGAVQMGAYIRENPLLLLVFAAAAFFTWTAFMRQTEKKKYRHPAVFLLLSYCVYCAMFAPEIYAGVEVSGGVYNMNYYVFLFMVFGGMIYTEGFLAYRSAEVRRSTDAAYPHTAAGRMSLGWKLILFAAFAGLLLVFKGTIKDTTTFACIDYMKSGQAADFKKQMEEQKAILLDSEVREVIVPAINDNQGPLMHMPVTEDPQAWSNTVVGEFYGKDSVTSIPREDWDNMQRQGTE